MKLFNHQQDGIDFFAKNKGIGAIYWDMGVGKTLTAIMAYECARRNTPNHPTTGYLQLLVVCPITLIESAWIEDIKEFTGLTYENLRNTQELEADILLINYETFKSKKFEGTLKRLLALRPMCVLDESQKIKSYNSQITKALLKAAPSFPYKMIMSATPAPNCNSEYWSQMCFLSPRILGDNFFKFRNRYMGLSRGEAIVPLHGLGRKEMMMMMQRGYTLDMLPGMENDFQGRMKPYCMYVDKNDVLDLPDEINVNRFVDMTKPQAKAYKQMYNDLVMEINDEEISVPNALARLMKVRQVTGGFAYVQGKEAEEFSNNPKLRELIEVIDGIGSGKSICIFCQYKWEIEKIKHIIGERATCLYGDTKDRDGAIREFRKRENGILISHPASGGVGLSFNKCDYMIFYSLSYSFMEYYQARGRIMRANKKNNATYIHLIARNSIDEVIMGALMRKEDNHKLFKEIMK